MTKMTGPINAGLLSVVIVGIIGTAMMVEVTSQGYNGTQNNGTYPGNLVLNIYIDEGGKALITGYADSINGLPFLKGSQYKYDNSTKQLYALTNSLTDKSGDDWKMKLPTQGNYSEYHSIFYLPASVKISKIDSTSGLDYLVSAANDSFQVDFHGYDVKSPTITIDYQIPLTGSTTPSITNAGSLMPMGTLLGLVLVSGLIVIWIKRRSSAPSDHGDHELEEPRSLTNESQIQVDGSSSSLDEVDSPQQRSNENEQILAEDHFVIEDELPIGTKTQLTSPESIPSEVQDNFIEPIEEQFKNNDDQYAEDLDVPESDESIKSGIDTNNDNNIEITSEMAAVMETLTARERAVLSTLIEHNGKMNQADIRYETSIPKSSLTGILLSLERRKLITKKEKGRTNAIELSSWFLAKKDSSEHD